MSVFGNQQVIGSPCQSLVTIWKIDRQGPTTEAQKCNNISANAKIRTETGKLLFSAIKLISFHPTISPPPGASHTQRVGGEWPTPQSMSRFDTRSDLIYSLVFGRRRREGSKHVRLRRLRPNRQNALQLLLVLRSLPHQLLRATSLSF